MSDYLYQKTSALTFGFQKLLHRCRPSSCDDEHGLSVHRANYYRTARTIPGGCRRSHRLNQACNALPPEQAYEVLQLPCDATRASDQLAARNSSERQIVLMSQPNPSCDRGSADPCYCLRSGSERPQAPLAVPTAGIPTQVVRRSARTVRCDAGTFSDPAAPKWADSSCFILWGRVYICVRTPRYRVRSVTLLTKALPLCRESAHHWRTSRPGMS